MPKIAFVGPSYQSRSLRADAQRTLNAYVELDGASPRAPIALHGRPGLVLADTIGTGPIRGMQSFQDYGILVTGNKVYSAVYSGGTYTMTLLGTIGTSSGAVGLAFNGTHVGIVDGLGGWLADLTTLTQITDVDFPNGVTQIATVDGYFIVCGDGTQQFYINETPGSGSAWNALDYGSAEGSPDNTVACVANHREVWFFGAHSAEVFTNTGNADFPFERNESAFMEIGTAAAWSVRSLDNTVYWLGRDGNGHGIVYRAQGYSPTRISTHAVEKAIQGYSTISDAVAYTFQMEGHAFYVLNFPTAGKTWVFDASVGDPQYAWSEWCYRNTSTGAEERWRPVCHAFIGGKNHVGDYANGKIYRLDLDTYTDAGDPIKRLRASQCMDSPNGHRNFYEQLIVDMDVGSGTGTVSMRYSNDGGNTWSTAKTAAVTNGDYGTRVKYGPTGAGRNRVWEISSTSTMKWSILGAYARRQEGTS